MTALRHLGVLTGGGDCPGMNAALRAVVKSAVHRHGLRVTGFLDGFAGLVEGASRPLAFDDVTGILDRGGTILGTSNRHDPFRMPTGSPGAYADRSDAAIAGLERNGVDALIAIGGDGTLGIAERLGRKGVPIIGLPKTIDNDVAETDQSVGFDTARALATEAVDRLHSTAASHHRIMAVEVMGRHAGWIALEAGLAGGGDVILLPEIPWTFEAVARAIRARTARGRRFSIVVVAEGARCPERGEVVREVLAGRPEPMRLGGVGAVVADALGAMLPLEARWVALGHVQRGGPPTALDRMLATRFGVAAVQAAVDGAWNAMVALRGDRIERVPIAAAVARRKSVDPDGDRVAAARAIDVAFGDEREAG
jgi:6-phosphofructokinase 1